MDNSREISWKSLWNRSQGSIYQSWDWIKIQDSLGVNPNILTIENQGKISAAVAGFEKTLHTPLGKKRIFQIYGDPIYINEDSCKNLLEDLKKKSKEYFYTTISPSSSKVAQMLDSLNFSKSLNSTIVLDLDKDKDYLWSQLEKKSIRWGVKTAEKNGLNFSQTTSNSDIESFYSLYVKTATDGKFKAESKEIINSLIKSGMTNLFIVKKKSELVAGGMVINDVNKNKSILEMTSASEEGLDLQAMPFLYWNMIIHAKSKGFLTFDLGGYDLDARPGEKTYNINKFKERFGGQITELPVYSSNSKYSLVRSIMRKFRFVKKLYKKS